MDQATAAATAHYQHIAKQAEHQLSIAQAHEMNVQAKADSDLALANANGIFVVDERPRFESEAFAKRQETLQEAAFANQYKTQAEKQWDHSRAEFA